MPLTTARRPTEPRNQPTDEPARATRVLRSIPRRRRRQEAAGEGIGRAVAIAMLVGLVAAVAVVIVPVLPPDADVLTGAVLLGLGSGWALLAAWPVRWTDRPQRWAAAPAVFLAVAGVVSISGSAAAQLAFGWVWPPVLLVMAAWMVQRVRRHVRSRPGRWLLYPIVLVLAAAAAGSGYETTREAWDVRAYPMPGGLVDVGGHRLHLRCTGSGSPTVVLEPGLGGSSSDLAWIAPVVARDTRVCVYDRAGRGWSDPVHSSQDGNQIAADLHTMLAVAHIRGPYVLAGHSFGGLYVLNFAAQFPDEVAGLVLLDSTAPRPGPAGSTDSPSTPSPLMQRVVAVLPALAPLGAGRVLAHVTYDSLPPHTQEEARARASTARHLASNLQEYLAGSASIQQASALTDLGGKPLLVLTADTGHDATWWAAQDHLATLSTNSLHRIAPDTTHVSMIYDENDSAAASRSVRDVVAAVRSHRPLPAG
ncbi:MAG TPA: alpha/beta hydrolase [Microlunatus sp.]|nr:alpha/beta hydrolase [Microlunatus sp.]